MTNTKIKNPAHEAEVETAKQSEAQLAVLDRAAKMAREKARLDLVKAAQDERLAVAARAECTGDRHYGPEHIRPSITITTPTPEIRPAMNKHYSDPATYGMNDAQRALYGLPTAPVAPTPSITLKTQPGVQHPRRGDTYSDVYEDAAEASRRAAELSVRPTPSVPTKECLNCGEQIAKSSAWHRKADDTACVLPGEEAFALRDAGVRQGQQLPGTK